MKKIALLIAMVTFGFVVNAQDSQISAGANVGLPLGNAGKTTKFMFSVEGNYLFEVVDRLKVGPSLSYHYFLGKSAEDYLKETLGQGAYDLYKRAKEAAKKNGWPFVDPHKNLSTSVSFLPIAAAARFNITDEFVAGLDLGYAASLAKNGVGGLYFRPLLGYELSDSMMIQASHALISAEGGSISSLNAGIMFSF